MALLYLKKCIEDFGIEGVYLGINYSNLN